MKRRVILQAGGAAVAVGLAGCGAGPSAGDDTTESSDSFADTEASPTTTDETRSPPSLTGTDIESAEASCGTGEDEATVVFDGVVRIDGTVAAPTPCHSATVDAVSYDEESDTLSVTVDVEDSDDGACMQCMADVSYTVTASFDGRLPARVVVEHVGHDGPVTQTRR